MARNSKPVRRREKRQDARLRRQGIPRAEVRERRARMRALRRSWEDLRVSVASAWARLREAVLPAIRTLRPALEAELRRREERQARLAALRERSGLKIPAGVTVVTNFTGRPELVLPTNINHPDQEGQDQ